MLIHFCNEERKKKVRYAGFSFPTLFFGSFYFFFCKYFFFGFLSLLFEYWLLPIPGMEEICAFFEMSETMTNLMMFSRTYFIDFWPYLILICLRLCIAPWFSHLRIAQVLKKKNGYLPSTSKDQENLVKFSKRYERIPVDPIYMRKVTFQKEETSEVRVKEKNVNFTALHPDHSLSDKEYVKKKRKQQVQQKKMERLYEKYEKGEITSLELQERQEKLL